MSNLEQEFLKEIKQRIEEKFFPDATSLKGRDLEYLATIIQEKSGISLSLSTLKRFWKGDFTQSPHTATLNALVSLLGYKTWQAYKAENTNTQKKKAINLTWTLLVLPVLLALTFVLYKVNPTKEEFLKNDDIKVHGDISFSADKTVSVGVPNTVIFNYDLSNVKADSFFIQQSWNEKHKVKIDPEKDVFTSIYYTPSFHQAKLIANETIIATQDVHIINENWVAYAKYSMEDQIPIYIQTDDFGANDQWRIQEKDLVKAGVNIKKEFYLRYCNIREFDSINDQNFSVKTKIKMEETGIGVCPFIELMLVFEQDIFWIDLTQKGCESVISYKIGEHYFSGKENDLSLFGCDLQEWQVLALEVEDRQAKLMLNEKPITNLTYQDDFGELKGIIYTFKGIGSVNYLELSNQ